MEEAPALLVQGFLREYGAKNLAEKFHLTWRTHPKYPNLHLFKYKQAASPLEEPIVQECRGIILDEAQDWGVVCYPYKKFFNYAEPNAVEIDWSSATVQEKVDGSLISLYWYNDCWNMSSSGMPDGTAQLHGSELIFSDLFWSIWKEKGYVFPKDTTKCYMFEMITPKHVIVVRPQEEEIYLHGVRDLLTLQEVHPAPYAEEFSWAMVKSYPYSSLEEVIDSCRSLDPLRSEGYVVCDANWNRVKIKAPQYVAISHLSIYDTKGMNLQNMIEIVRTNEGSEFVTYFPEHKTLHDETREAYKSIILKMQAHYDAAISILMLKAPTTTPTVEEFDKVFKKVAEVSLEIRFFYRLIGHHAYLRSESIAKIMEKAQVYNIVELVKSELPIETRRALLNTHTGPRKSKKRNRRQRQHRKERQAGEEDDDESESGSEDDDEETNKKGGKAKKDNNSNNKAGGNQNNKAGANQNNKGGNQNNKQQQKPQNNNNKSNNNANRGRRK